MGNDNGVKGVKGVIKVWWGLYWIDNDHVQFALPFHFVVIETNCIICEPWEG